MPEQPRPQGEDEDEVIFIQNWERLRDAIRRHAIKNAPDPQKDKPAKQEMPSHEAEEAQRKKTK